MKWYWVVLIILAVLAVSYFLIRKASSGQTTSCRAGTCPFVRSDGSIFCTSAACPKSNERTIVETIMNPTPTRTIVLVNAPRTIPTKNVSSQGTTPRTI